MKTLKPDNLLKTYVIEIRAIVRYTLSGLFETLHSGTDFCSKHFDV